LLPSATYAGIPQRCAHDAAGGRRRRRRRATRGPSRAPCAGPGPHLSTRAMRSSARAA
jgi:hypothetical protein